MLMNMKDILAVAKENKFAIPAFNISDYSMFLGIMDVCEETNSPVIIEIHPDELSFTGPEMVLAIKERAYKSPVPVCIHLDHCSDFGTIIYAIQSGFTSVMFDGAELPFEENIAGAKKVVEAAHPANVSVEAELGTIGSTDPADFEGGTAKIIYTNPDDAAKFVAETGVDTLAVAIGTCHGLYPAGQCARGPSRAHRLQNPGHQRAAGAAAGGADHRAHPPDPGPSGQHRLPHPGRQQVRQQCGQPGTEAEVPGPVRLRAALP